MLQPLTANNGTPANVSENSFRTLAENLPDVVSRHDVAFRYTYANRRIEAYTGKKPEELIGKNFRELGMPDEVCTFFEENISIVFETGAPHTVEFANPLGSGHLLARLMPEFSSEGSVESVLIINTDISERKKTEEALAYQKLLLETVTDNTDMALFLMDANQFCVYINEAAEKMTGFSLDELKGKQLHYFVHHTYPDGKPYPLEECPIDQALPTHKRMKGEEVFVHKNGSFYPVAFTASPIIIDGNATGTVIEVRDTSDDKRAKQELERSERYFRELTDTVPAIIWITRPDGYCTYLNKNWYAYTGQSPEEAEGFGWLDATHPDDKEEAGRLFIEATEEQKPYYMLYRLRHKDGGYRWAIDSGSPKYSADGVFEGMIGTVVDVHEQKLAEDKIKENEELFRSFSNNIQNLAWIADGEGYIYWYNQRWYDYTGTTLEEMRGWGWEKVHHPDHISRVVSFVKNAWLRNEPWELTFPLKGADGVYRWFLTRAVPTIDAEGKITRWIGTNTNVNEQVEALQKVEASEAQFRTLIEEAPVATCVFKGPEMKIEIANEKIIAIMGKGRSVIGKPLAEALPELTGQPFLEELGRVFVSGQTYENRNVYSELLVDGVRKVFYFDYIFKPLRNAAGEVYAVLDMTIDVTDHVLARRELEESESRFRTLANDTSAFMFMADADANVQFVNRRWLEFVGMEQNENIGQAWTAVTHPDDIQMSYDVYADAVHHLKPYQIEARQRRSDGQWRWIRWDGITRRDISGAFAGVIGVGLDITEQKQFTQELEALVTERTRELLRSNEDLQQFAHVASHDLKEPVRKVITFQNRLKDELGQHVPDKVRAYLNKIESASTRMYQMIDGVLAYSTLNATSITKQPVALTEVFNNIENDLEVVIAQKRAEILRTDLPVVSGSPVLLYQLFYNLVSNSLKFAKTDTPAKIEVSTLVHHGLKGNKGDQQQFHVIVVQDNGIGFNQSEAEKIFQTFSRLNSKDQYEGTGLGLSLCKKIVERHGGFISAKGTKGVGAIFEVYLPFDIA